MRVYQLRLKFQSVVPKGLVNNMPALGQIMAWYRPGDKPLSETIMARLLRHMRHSASMCWPSAVGISAMQPALNVAICVITLQRLARVLKWLMV